MISEVIDSINDNITDTLGFSSEQVYGIAELLDIDSRKYPAIYNDGQWDQISPDDCNELMLYHRVESVGVSDNEDLSFGLDQDNQDTFNMIMTVVLKKPNSYDEAISVKRAIPKSITNANYAFVTTSIVDINNNQDDIVLSEWGEQEYRRHKSDFSIFQISYQIELITC